MATIYTKVHEYNKDTQTVVASFASTATKSQNPDSHQKLNFDIDSSGMQLIKKPDHTNY